MPAVQESALLEALKTVVDPHTGRDFVSGKQVKNLRIDGGDVSFEVELGYPGRSQEPGFRKALVAAAKTVPGVENVSVQIATRIIAHAVQRGVALLPGVKNIIAVASGKGGVGKSTTTANLALALAAEGASVGILDADIYGPSQPMMMGITGQPESTDGKTMQPMENHGVQVMSIGFMVQPDQAMIWRGPMATQALDQLLRQTNWRDLDYLLVDMPPGTGDVAISLGQLLPRAEAVIVTTPQPAAQEVAVRAAIMAQKTGMRITGVIENMSYLVGTGQELFGSGGGQALAAEIDAPLLGKIPLDPALREAADAGTPITEAAPESEVALAIGAVADELRARRPHGIRKALTVL